MKIPFAVLEPNLPAPKLRPICRKAGDLPRISLLPKLITELMGFNQEARMMTRFSLTSAAESTGIQQVVEAQRGKAAPVQSHRKAVGHQSARSRLHGLPSRGTDLEQRNSGSGSMIYFSPSEQSSFNSQWRC